MPRTTIDWESRIGRRLSMRDLHVFVTVVQRGSMAKAAQQLNVTQPAVSKAISDLEHALGVRLLDRRMIRGGFLSAEDRKHLIALARDGSAAARLTRRANALAGGAVKKSRQRFC